MQGRIAYQGDSVVAVSSSSVCHSWFYFPRSNNAFSSLTDSLGRAVLLRVHGVRSLL